MKKSTASIKTNGTITATAPFGGEACSDFASGCPNKGETCAGPECGVPLLDSFSLWAIYCPTNQGSLTIASDTTLAVASALPTDKCWGHVTINNSTTLTLETTTIPYFFETLELSHTSSSSINIVPTTANGYVELYVLNIDGNNMNGNQAVNSTGTATQFFMYYLGSADLTLNGNADMNVALTAPNAGVTISGNFDFSGALLAKRATVTGSGGFHYDEDLFGKGRVNDVQYRIKHITHSYY